MKKDKEEERQVSAAVLTSDGKMTSEQATQLVFDVVERLNAEEEEQERSSARLPRTALVIPKDGERPEGLTARTAARIMYDGKEYVLTQAQRHVLNVFVYETDLKKTRKADTAAKSKMTTTGRLRYIRTRNAFLALYFFGIPVYNDAWALHTACELFRNLQTDDEEAKANFQSFVEINRLRLDTAFRSVEKFCDAYDVPRFLWPTLLQQARDMFEQDCSACLFDPYEKTLNRQIFERMFDDYLKGCFFAQNNF